MKKTEDAAIEQPFVKWCKRNGVLQRKMNMPGPFGQKGWPDRSMWLEDGKVRLLEFKRPGKKKNLTPLQEQNQKLLKELGYEVNTFDDWDELHTYLTAALETSRLSTRGRQVPGGAPSRSAVPAARRR